MTPKELADNESTIKIDNDDVLMVLIDGKDAWDYYAPESLKDKWTRFKQRTNFVYLVLDKNGDNNYVITYSNYSNNQNVIDKNYRYVPIQDVVDTFPSIESELLDYFDVDTTYSVLKRIKNGKKYDRWDLSRIDENIVDIEFIQKIPSKSMIKISIEFEDFVKLFDIGDESEVVINSIYSYGGYDFIDDDRIWDDWREGYFYGNFNEENEKLIKDIVSFISPNILSLGKKNNDEFGEAALEVLNDNFGRQCGNIMSEFVSLANNRANKIVKNRIEQDFYGVFNDIGIIQPKVGDYFYTTVGKLIFLYEQNNNKTDTIFELIEKLAQKTNINTKNYWEYGNDEAFLDGESNTIFQEYVKSELNDILDKIENNPEDYEGFKNYSETYEKLNKLGYQLDKQYKLPSNPNKSFKIQTIDKYTGKIRLVDWDGKRGEVRTYSFEEFTDYLHTPELFENFIRKFKK